MPTPSRKLIGRVGLLLLLTQSNFAFAQLIPGSNYSDQWAKEKHRLNADQLFKNQEGMLVAGTLIPAFVSFISSLIYFEGKPYTKSRPLIILSSLASAGAAGFFGSWNTAQFLASKEKFGEIMKLPLDQRVASKLNSDLNLRLKATQTAQNAGAAPIGDFQNMVARRGLEKVQKDIDNLFAALKSEKSSQADLLHQYQHLLGNEDRELVRAIYKVRRSENAGADLSAINEAPIKTIAANPMNAEKSTQKLAGAAR